VPTGFAVLDDFATNENRTDTTEFGGYWYTFDDAVAQIGPTTQCGNSTIWPISDSVAIQTPNCTPTFVISDYVADGETPPPEVTAPYFARVHGNVDRSATGYQYGFAGFGANLLDVAADNFKNTINATARGYTRLQFWYKNGPTVTASTPWKIKLPNSALVGGVGPCKMEEGDDVPVCVFTSTNVWQKFDKNLLTDFANEGWPTVTKLCDIPRNTITSCSTATSISYYDNASYAQFKCTSAEALVALNAIQWQTNFAGVAATNAFDLEVAQVVFIK
jgi:hypothetical protein